MKLRMNKFTMVCAVVLSSAVLFGTNSVNVQAADNTGGSSVGTSQFDTEYTYVDGQSSSDTWYGIAWHVYKINGDENNLQLRLGTEGVIPKNPALQTPNPEDSDWEKYRSKISSVKFVGKIITNSNQPYLLAGMANLKSVSGLGFLQTSDSINLSNMFNGDKKLSSVDLSPIDMSKAADVKDMFKDTNLSSITLGPNSVINNSGIPDEYTSDGKTYISNSWSDASDKSRNISTQDLMDMYSVGSNERTQTTWVRSDPTEKVNYYVQYVDGVTGKEIPNATYDVPEMGILGSTTININPFAPALVKKLQPGYEAYQVKDDSYGTIESDGKGKYYLKVPLIPVAPVNIAVTEKVGSDQPKNVSFTIPVNDTNYKYSDISEPQNGTLDLDKSTISIQGNKKTFKEYSSETDLNKILSKAIEDQFNGSGVFNEYFESDSSSKTPITVNAVYTKKSTSGGSSSSGNHHNSNNSNENNTEDNTENKGGTTTEVKQTISTTNKDVNLYDKDGKLITDRVLAENSAWFSDQTYDLNGTSYYRVANGEYVKASDVYIYTAENHIIDVKGKSIVFMADSNGHKVTNRALGPNSEWYSDRYTIINGQKYYRVATDEFVSAADIALL